MYELSACGFESSYIHWINLSLDPIKRQNLGPIFVLLCNDYKILLKPALRKAFQNSDKNT